MDYTTIQIDKLTREKLNKLKINSRQTYSEILNALMDLIPIEDDEGKYTEEFRSSLLRGILDIKHGRTHTLDQVKERLGIK